MLEGLRGCEKMGEKHENTNLASEFYVLSMLHRQGFNATVTLGNKKSVDIVIEKGINTKTVDVKGIKKSSGSFPVDNWIKKKNHFYAFVAWGDLNQLPEVFIVPSSDLDRDFKELNRYEKNPRKLIYLSPQKYKRVALSRLRKIVNRGYNWNKLKIDL